MTSRVVTSADNTHAAKGYPRGVELARVAIRFSVFFSAGAFCATVIDPGFIPEDMSLTVH